MEDRKIWESELAAQILELQTRLGRMTLVGLAGVPGSGKTVSAHFLSAKIRQSMGGREKSCTIVPMDGFHYYKRELDLFPDPVQAHFRRGAEFTFNAEALFRKIERVKSGEKTMFPSFSHAVGDPVEDSIEVDPTETSVLIIEGLYLFLEQDVWRDIRALFDLKLYLDCPLIEAMDRTFLRNARCLPYPEDVVRDRVLRNDRVNGLLVEGSKSYADVIVQFYPKSPEELLGME